MTKYEFMDRFLLGALTSIMPAKILGLDIQTDSVTGVMVASVPGGHQILACRHVSLVQGNSLDEALKTVIEAAGADCDLCISSVPASYASYRNLSLPFTDKKKIRQALVFELETMIPFQVDDLLVDFTALDRLDKGAVLTASIKRDYLAEYLKLLNAHGVEPEIVDISGVPTSSCLVRQEKMPNNGLLLEIGSKTGAMILYINRRVALVRAFSLNSLIAPEAHEDDGKNEPTPDREQIENRLRIFCTQVKNTLHSYRSHDRDMAPPEKAFVTGSGAVRPDTPDLLGRFLEVPVERLDLSLSLDSRITLDEHIAQAWNPSLMNNALALALRQTKQAAGFNFRRDGFEVKKKFFGYKKEVCKAAAFLGVFLSVVALNLGIDYHYLNEHDVLLDRQITEEFKKAFPDVKRIVDPLQQMQIKVSEIKKSAVLAPRISAQARAVDLLKDISVKIPGSADVDLERVVVEADSILIKGETDTFNTVDSVKKGLDQSDLFNKATISSADLDRTGKRVRFEIKLERTN